MAEFRFRLATLLRLRETTRDECRVILAEVCRADEKLRDQLAELGIEQQRLQNQYREAIGPGTIDLDRLVETHHYIATLRVREEDMIQQRQTLAAEIQRRRESLLKADQDVQVLEKLRDRRRLRHRVQEERQESKLLDEAALHAVAS